MRKSLLQLLPAAPRPLQLKRKRHRWGAAQLGGPPKGTCTAKIRSSLPVACFEARSISSFVESLDHLLHDEWSRTYAVYRPSDRASMSPSELVRIMEKARDLSMAAGGSVMPRSPQMVEVADGVDDRVIELWDLYQRLWAKSVDPRCCTNGGWSVTGEAENVDILARGFAATVGSLPSETALRLIAEDAFAALPALTALPETLQQLVTSVSRALGDVLSDDALSAVSLPASATPSDLSRGNCEGTPPAHNPSQPLPPWLQCATVDTFRRFVRSPLVISAVLGTLMAVRAPAADIVEHLEQYAALSLRGSIRREEYLVVVRNGVRAAASRGDIELVTRLVFQSHRVFGALSPAPITPSSGMGVVGAKRQLLDRLVARWRRSSAVEYDTDRAFCAAATDMLGDAVDAAFAEGGAPAGIRMFEALSHQASVEVTATMALRLLRRLPPVLLNGKESPPPELQNSVFHLWSRVAASFEREKKMWEVEKRSTMPITAPLNTCLQLLDQVTWRALELQCGSLRLRLPNETMGDQSTTVVEIPVCRYPTQALQMLSRLASWNGSLSEHGWLVVMAAAVQVCDHKRVELCLEHLISKADASRNKERVLLVLQAKALAAISWFHSSSSLIDLERRLLSPLTPEVWFVIASLMIALQPPSRVWQQYANNFLQLARRHGVSWFHMHRYTTVVSVMQSVRHLHQPTTAVETPTPSEIDVQGYATAMFRDHVAEFHVPNLGRVAVAPVELRLMPANGEALRTEQLVLLERSAPAVNVVILGSVVVVHPSVLERGADFVMATLSNTFASRNAPLLLVLPWSPLNVRKDVTYLLQQWAQVVQRCRESPDVTLLLLDCPPCNPAAAAGVSGSRLVGSETASENCNQEVVAAAFHIFETIPAMSRSGLSVTIWTEGDVTGLQWMLSTVTSSSSADASPRSALSSTMVATTAISVTTSTDMDCRTTLAKLATVLSVPSTRHQPPIRAECSRAPSGGAAPAAHVQRSSTMIDGTHRDVASSNGGLLRRKQSNH